MTLLHDVTLTDSVDVTDFVERTPSRIDVIIQDVISITDLVLEPRSTAIDSVSPGLVRAGDTVTIQGQGFATSTGTNRVTFNGISATIVSAAEDQLVVTAPGFIAFTENGFVSIEVESPPFNPLKGRARAWVKWSTAEEEADETLPLQLADVREVIGGEQPRIAEAQDYNSLLTLVEHSQQGGAEEDAGGFKARDDVGLVKVERRNPPDNSDTQGECLVIDPSTPAHVAFGWMFDDLLAYGGTYQAANSGGAFLRANGTPDAVLNLVETEHVAMLDGIIDLAYLLITGAGDDIRNPEIWVEGVQVATNPQTVLPGNVLVWRPTVEVSKGDRIEFRVTKFGATQQIRLVGGLRVRYR